MSTYTVPGATVGASLVGALIRESAYYPCPDIGPDNQALTAQTWGCLPLSCCTATIRVDFDPPPAEPVLHVAAEVRSTVANLVLEVYDANDGFLAGTSIRPPPVGCNLPSRGLLQDSIGTPIAYALIFSHDDPPPPGCEDCCVAGGILVVDNITFDSAQVPVRPVSWGTLTVRYR